MVGWESIMALPYHYGMVENFPHHYGMAIFTIMVSTMEIRNGFEIAMDSTNVAERPFSKVASIFTDYRKAVTPVNLENQIFSNVNHEFWDLYTVNAITVDDTDDIDDDCDKE